MGRHVTDAGDAATGHDALDVQLRAARPAPLQDDGFTARVMAALPPVAAAMAPAWRKPVVAALWTLALLGAVIALPGVLQDVVREGYRVFTAYPVSLPQLSLAIVAAAAVMWTGTALALRRHLAALG